MVLDETARVDRDGQEFVGHVVGGHQPIELVLALGITHQDLREVSAGAEVPSGVSVSAAVHLATFHRRKANRNRSDDGPVLRAGAVNMLSGPLRDKRPHLTPLHHRR